MSICGLCGKEKCECDAKGDTRLASAVNAGIFDQNVVRYVGRRDGGNTASQTTVTVEYGKSSRPLRSSVLGKNKSPCGFNWGYGGSGPAALAHSILINILKPEHRYTADTIYQEFKREIIATLPTNDGFTLEAEAVKAWVSKSLMEISQ